MFASRYASSISIWILAFGVLRAQERRIAGPIEDAKPAVVHGSVPPNVQRRYDQGRVEGSLPIPFVTLTMKPSAAQQTGLEQLLKEQQDRSSPNYRRWLTPEEFGDRFGLASSDYDAVLEWLKSHHLRIEQVARARNWVTFSGAARDLETAFHTEIHRYVVEGQSHVGNAGDVSVPRALRDVVGGVRGLDDFWRLPPAAIPENTNASGVHQLAPGDWATIYDVSPLYAMGIDGTGQRIGILGRSAMNQSYIDQFRSQFGLPPTRIEQHLAGPDPGITNAAGEAALDLEWSGAIARGATIVYIYSGSFNDSAQAAIDQNLASVISESFGVCEPQGDVGTRLMAQQANAQGITWVASSGDSGAAGCDPHGFFHTTGNAKTVSDGPAVSIPASFPEVTAVGGTQFNEAGGAYWGASNGADGGSALSYIPEMVWNETGAGGLLASGGGASLYFPKPAWQAGPGVPADNFRDVPDIAFSAAGNHDPYMVVNANGQGATGGTSAGAPSFAGVVALLNHYLISKAALAQPGLGNINADLYRLARTTTGIFHDITQGDNIVPCAAGSPGCVNGGLGVAAGPGYDLATGLGSIDVYNLVTQWNTATARTTLSLTASPSAIAFGGSTQLTAVVSPAAAGAATPSGAVTFTAGRFLLGARSLVNVAGAAMATLTVSGDSLPAGNASVTASYAGDANFSASSGSATVTVSAGPGHSSVSVDITPNPAHEGQFITVTLREEAGVATAITGWTINGVDDFSLFAPDFGGTSLPPFGALSATIPSARPATLPSPRVYLFTGQDADGRTWSLQYTLTLEGPLETPGVSMLSAPAAVQQNPSADPSCQWSQQLIVQENLGFAVQLTRLLVGGADWTSRMQQLFGSTRLAALGMLQARVCWPGPTAPPPTLFEVDGADETGVPVSATFQAVYTGGAASASALAAAQSSITLFAGTAPAAAGGNLTVNFAGSGALSVSVLPANRSTSWLMANALTSASSHQVTLLASAAGLAPGAYSATLLIQAVDAIPQFIEAPIVFLVGTTSGIAIDHIANGASFQPAFAPGMVLSVFGSQLAPSAQAVSAPPLPAVLAGVSATVNGIPAPFYYASANQLNIQIPYEAGSGPAVLGVNNNGQVASFLFPIAAAAPGIFADYSQGSALVPSSSGKRGDTLMLFMTGEGQVSPALANGASPFASTPIGLLPQPALPVAVTVGGAPAQILFVGVPSGLVGASQINFIIPETAPTGVQPVVVTVAGVSSPAASLTVNP